jgi:hypothetical protein
MYYIDVLPKARYVPAEFTVVSTHQSALGPRGGLWPILFMYNPEVRPVPMGH